MKRLFFLILAGSFIFLTGCEGNKNVANPDEGTVSKILNNYNESLLTDDISPSGSGVLLTIKINSAIKGIDEVSKEFEERSGANEYETKAEEWRNYTSPIVKDTLGGQEDEVMVEETEKKENKKEEEKEGEVVEEDEEKIDQKEEEAQEKEEEEQLDPSTPIAKIDKKLLAVKIDEMIEDLSALKLDIQDQASLEEDDTIIITESLNSLRERLTERKNKLEKNSDNKEIYSILKEIDQEGVYEKILPKHKIYPLAYKAQKIGSKSLTPLLVELENLLNQNQSNLGSQEDSVNSKVAQARQALIEAQQQIEEITEDSKNSGKGEAGLAFKEVLLKLEDINKQLQVVKQSLQLLVD